MSPPLIRAVKRQARQADFTVPDAPPGASCPVVESVRDADVVVLVAEPTPFGLNALELAADMVAALGRHSGRRRIERDEGLAARAVRALWRDIAKG